jgi:hypothetical protein
MDTPGSGHLIVIPAFNEARTIGAVVAGARRHGPVLVVDDGSTDGTGDVARAAGADVLILARRQGKGGALRAGVDVGRRRGADRVVTLDGDGQHDPGDIPRLLATAGRSPRAIVVGARPADPRPASRARWNACRVAGFFVDWITDAVIRDTQSGFRAYPRGLFDEVAPRHGGFVLETELLIAAARAGRPIVEVELSATAPPARPSRFHPLADGGAIGAFIAAAVVRRGLREARAAAREVAAVFERARLRARHAEMAEAGAHYPDAPHLYGFAVAGVAVRHARARVLGWWRHPRRRRLALVLQAAAASPVLLALAAGQTLLGRVGLDVVTPFVNRFYSHARLVAAGAPAARPGPRESGVIPTVAPVGGGLPPAGRGSSHEAE